MESAVCAASGIRDGRPARGSVRYSIHLPAIVLADGEQSEAVTADISASGVLFQLRQPLHVGQDVEFLLEIPAGTLDFSHTAAMHCRGRIIRSYWKDGSPWAAAVIDDYRFQ
ncbi:MAG TPA: PilZ domain-containing protein [Acidobacteriaceae bacterium]|nr:PilZ domain-containing protein [Acidobacteriaceae bacterium]